MPDVRQFGVQSTDMATKDARWNLRVTAAQDAAVRRAVLESGESLNDYVVRHVVEAATNDLADRRVFALDDDAWDELQARLDRPASPNAAMSALLSTPSVLDPPSP